MAIEDTEHDEEEFGDLTKLPNAVYHVDPTPETVDGWQEKLDKDYLTYGRFFISREECDIFTMLPLNDEQRIILLLKMGEERKEADKKKNML